MLKQSLTVLALLFLAQEAAADFLDFTFVGTLPAGASQHSMVSDGEIWTAVMRVDSTTADVNSNPNVGLYEGAVVFGSLEFSGGYVAESTDFSGSTAFILNDVFSADSIRVRGESGLSDFVFQANSEDLSTLTNDLIPGPGTTIDPFPSIGTFEYFQLTFDDEFGFINYFANVENNVTVTITQAIPEPGVGAICFLFGAFAIRRKK